MPTVKIYGSYRDEYGEEQRVVGTDHSKGHIVDAIKLCECALRTGYFNTTLNGKRIFLKTERCEILEEGDK